MGQLLIFLFASLLAAPGWLLVKQQVASVSPELSVGLRFLIAAVFVDIFRKVIREQKTDLPLNIWPYVVAQGLFLYGINAWLYYYSSLYMISGLIAVTISTMIIPNIFFSKLFFKSEISYRTLIGGCIGVSGVIVLFSQEILNTPASNSILIGLSLALFGNLFGVLGTQASSYVLKGNVPLLSCTSKALYIGSISSLSLSILKEGIPEIPLTLEFWSILLYLGVLNSAVSFIVYSYAIKKHGPAVASYLWILTPATSLALSSFYEMYQWTLYSTAGVSLIVLGSFIVVRLPYKFVWERFVGLLYRKVFHQT